MTMAAAGLVEASPARRMSVLGVRVDAVRMDLAVRLICLWASSGTPRLIFLRDVASLMTAVDLPDLRRLHETAALVAPDGMPLVWYGLASGHGATIERVAGADLLEAIAAASSADLTRHFFYGGGPGIAEAVAHGLRHRHTNLKVAGTLTPPFRTIGPDYVLDPAALAEIETVRAAKPDIIWVGLSSPKQEFWMREAAVALGTGVFIGIGAAFDFHAGSRRRAPRWMRNSGLEWLHRLASEPRRLWYRYLVQAPRFVFMVAWQVLARREKVR